MKSIELSKTYDPKEFEDKISQKWITEGLFEPKEEGEGYFSLMMPPPNVTGILHMGHALNNSLPDVLVRFNRLQGKKTLWLPGTDHAGIATQHVVEKKLKEEGLRRQDLGREKFLERTWEVKDKHHQIITSQLKKMGSSCDWSRERFTMDEQLSKAVRESFVTLYERGLIYKGKYLVNYCPKCGTALADDEVEYENTPGALYTVAYPFADLEGHITVATTRPETMFGDAAIAVNPEDERYTHLIGQSVIIPILNKKIKIITDSFVEKEFGTGMVKITPAHDPNDFECGRRNNLEEINLLNPDGTLNENVPEKYRGLDPDVARELVLEDLRLGGYLLDTKKHDHEVGHCYRCSHVVEPYLSEQWFVSMKSMADKALAAWQNDEIRFYPKRWENTYSHWLTNIRDWCISRQLWWGHRIPVWYCNDCDHMMVSKTDICECSKCHSKDIRQEEDVLDTWFSSWLWPFSTLGWPNKTPDFEQFFPTSTLVSAYDIIFFWISRMIMASLEFTGKVPFRDVVITGLVRDKQGRKMSKSLGNGIDPLEIIAEYGSDAMKFTLCYLAAQGQDVQVDASSFKIGSHFANKIWNASRYIMMNIEGREIVKVESKDMTMFDKWIYKQLNQAIASVEKALTNYRFNDAASAIYSFFWNDYCDWYIEASKQRLFNSSDAEKNIAISILLDLLEKSYVLMHPFLPFITAELYSKLPTVTDDIMNASYPKVELTDELIEAGDCISFIQDIVKTIRASRSQIAIAPEKKIKVVIKTESKFLPVLKEDVNLIASFVGAKEIDFDLSSDVSSAFPSSGLGYEVFLFVKDAIDIDAEIAKLKKEIDKAEKDLQASDRKLTNEKFMANAKQEAIDKELSKKAEFAEKIEKANTHIKLLQSL